MLLELLTGKAAARITALHHEEPDLFSTMHLFADERAGEWPAAVVGGLAAVAEKCIAQQSRVRASVKEVLAELEALEAALH